MNSMWAAASVLLAGSVAGQTIYPSGVTIWNPAKTWNGHTLFATPGEEEVVLVDMSGRLIISWTSPAPGERATHVRPLDGGHVLFLSHDGTNPRQTAYEVDVAGNVVWSFTLDPAMGYLHHDHQRLPSGNTLFLCARTMTVPGISPQPIVDDFLIEVDPGGSIVWAWFGWQHYDDMGFSTAQKALIASRGGPWGHANSIDSFPPNAHTDPAFKEGNVVVSHRFSNIVFVIDKATGVVVWRSGPDDNVSWGQHTVHMIPHDLPGAGNLLIFDNGSGTGYLPPRFSPGYSSVIELDPVTKNPVWTYTADMSGLRKRTFWSDLVSGAQRLPNGNTLVCSGIRGRLFEVTASGEIVWEYLSPFTGAVNNGAVASRMVFRAYRVPRNWAYLPFPDPVPGE